MRAPLLLQLRAQHKENGSSAKDRKLNNKHLMTGHKGNSEFCFPETFNVPRGETERNIQVEGKQNSLFPEGPVIKCFVILPDSKIEKAPKYIICLSHCVH